MADPVIALERVTLRYPTAPSPTLRDISFRVEPGEFVGIAGSTGSGKSTLLYLLAGVIPHHLGAEIGGDAPMPGRRPQEPSHARNVLPACLSRQDPRAPRLYSVARQALSASSTASAPT